jgi:hypothetical protein
MVTCDTDEKKLKIHQNFENWDILKTNKDLQRLLVTLQKLLTLLICEIIKYNRLFKLNVHDEIWGCIFVTCDMVFRFEFVAILYKLKKN